MCIAKIAGLPCKIDGENDELGGKRQLTAREHFSRTSCPFNTSYLPRAKYLIINLSTYLPAVEVTSSRAVPKFATAVACKIFWLVVVVVKLGGFITSWIFRTNKYLPYIASLKELGSRPQSWGFSWFFNNISQDLNSLSPNKNICITKTGRPLQFFRLLRSKDLVDLPPPKFSPGYVLRVGEWNILAPWTMAWVKLCASCVWNLRGGTVFITDTSGGFAIGKKWGEFDQWIKVLIPQGVEFPSWKVIWHFEAKNHPSEKEKHLNHRFLHLWVSKCEFPRRLRRRRHGFWSFWKARYIGMLTGH